MAKTMSRTARWAQAAADAREAMDAVQNAAQAITDALQVLAEIQEEYSDWRDNLPENLQQGTLAEKLDAVCDLDLSYADDPLSNWDYLDDAVSEAEGADLPLGFGRD